MAHGTPQARRSVRRAKLRRWPGRRASKRTSDPVSADGNLTLLAARSPASRRARGKLIGATWPAAYGMPAQQSQPPRQRLPSTSLPIPGVA